LNHPDPRADLILLLPALRGYARFLVRDAAEADDLVQDAVVRALGALSQFQPGTNLRAWLFTILRNAFHEQARRRRTERKALQQSFDTDEVRAAAQHSRLDLADLQRHMFALSPLLREALVLVGAQQLSYDEAAMICSVPVGTMKARVSRARRQLAHSMARPEPSTHNEPAREPEEQT
jgi:RNA polymerase sigma-70 factor (ECF subfamily)